MLLEAHSALLDLLESELDEVGGLPLTWYDVLAQLEVSSTGRLTMNQLARSVLLSKSGITRLVDRMEKAGMIRRESCPTDRRVVYATPTSEGKKMFAKAAPVHLRGIEEHFSRHLTATETQAIKSALGKILKAAEDSQETSPAEQVAS
jgi:DNA-binding MarR family transcriptional regulator